MSLKQTGAGFFDFYLLHNVYENSIGTYTDSKWGIVDYFVKQKQLGRIKHLGFSCHGMQNILEDFLNQYGDVMEFCQIQVNYLDWTLQDAKAKYELLADRKIPVWVMEPVRGGKLANLDKASKEKLEKFQPEASAASWAFRWLQGLENVKMILSGMSDMEQVRDNVHTFEALNPLTKEEEYVLMEIAEGMKDSVPCTACRYCCGDCPKGLDIPKLLSLYNEMRVLPSFNVGMTIDSMEHGSRPSACIGCKRCAKVCPQKIDIPEAMKEFAGMLEKIPHWEDMCRQREEIARKVREESGC